MKKTKLEKGITLVALIITIVVLLILAVVSIGAVRNSGIIGHATNTSDSWKEAQANETTLLAGYEAELKEQMGIGPWTLQEDGKTIINGKTGEEKTLGNEIDNNDVLAVTGGTASTYIGTWTVIGVENGKLKLLTTENVSEDYVYLGKKDKNAPDTLEKSEDDLKKIYELDKDLGKAIWSYQHAEETLNNYAKEKTGIESARSITIEDIETALNITEEEKFKLGENYLYGSACRFFYDSESLEVKYQFRRFDQGDFGNVCTVSGSTKVFVDEDGNAILMESEGTGVELRTTDYTMYSSRFDADYMRKCLGGNNGCWLVGDCCVTYGDNNSFCRFNISQGTVSGCQFFTAERVN